MVPTTTVYGKPLANTSVTNQITTGTPTKIDQQLKLINQAIKDNQQQISKMADHITTTQSEIKKLKNKMAAIQKGIQQRNRVLKERVQSYQESGGTGKYLEVLLGSTTFGNFVERAATVAQIVQADRDLLKQQIAEKENSDKKQIALEKKVQKLTKIKTEYKEMIAQAAEQKRQYGNLKKQLAAGDQDFFKKHPGHSIPVSNSRQGYLAKIMKSSSKYIGNSVYVFSGGRTAADIANGRFDCSGFVHWAFSTIGREVGSSTDTIKYSGRQIPASELQPGDLIFFNTYKKDGHVGIYLGNGKFIGSQSSTGVAIADMSKGYWKNTFNGRVVRI